MRKTFRDVSPDAGIMQSRKLPCENTLLSIGIRASCRTSLNRILRMTSRLERLLRLDLAIRKGDFPSAETLCRLVEIQPRTLYQDLRELRENLGCDVRFDRVRSGYFNGSPDKKLPTFALTNEELLVIAVAAELFSQTGGEAVARILANAMTKILDGYQQKIPIAPESLRDWIRTEGQRQQVLNPSKLVGILEALNHEKQLKLSSAEKKDLVDVVKPYCLMMFDGQWEIVGYSVLKNKIVSRPLATSELELHEDGTTFEQAAKSPKDFERWIHERQASVSKPRSAKRKNDDS
ncbi:MAG: hypothetical protein K2W95_30320 [Candidatus Obscuribacterales bacterium]|nr:hypothetical protein [Candidatus Obscuribacterales bacterium]